MNAATAGGLLGGTATMSVVRVRTTPANPHAANGIDDSDCTFTRHSGSVSGELRIEVRTMSDPDKDFASFAARCGSHAIALKAIGNEAKECTLDGKSGANTEQIVGRVRDRAFVIRLRMKDPSMAPDLLRDKIRKAADIVSGNLF